VALPLFAVTLFVSAFLLFLVQPMIGKMILPRLGGTPQVWNTCMVFFQTALLAGYAYSHLVSSRLKLRQQLLLHGVLLLAPFVVLLPHGPFNISGWIPPPGANPIASTLLLLAGVVGLPFFVVSTSAPLLQRWFAYTGHPAAKDPYFLYAASNLGSMLALLAYPVLVEPYLHLRAFQEGPSGPTIVWLSQPWVWTLGYTLLVGLVLACCGLVWRAPAELQPADMSAASEEAPAAPTPRPAESRPAPPGTAFRRGRPPQRPTSRPIAPEVEQQAEVLAAEQRRLHQVTWGRRLRWVALAAVPSSLMLGIITYMSTDVSAIPLFWVIPLALYLLSFILVFLRWPIPWTGQPHTAMTLMHLPMIFGLLYILLTREVSPIWRSISFCLLGFFFTALMCHGELARDRPGTRHLTEYYLWMSVGGMLGGLFNGLIAPVLFWGLLELPVALVLSFFLRPFPSRLAPLELGAALLLGGGAGLVTGILLYQGVSLAVACTLLGLLLAWLYQPRGWGDPLEGWTERWLIRLFPDLGEWAQTTGEQLARRSPEAAPAPTRPGAARQRPNHYVLSYLLDFGMPLVLLLLTWYVVAYRSSRLQWLVELFLHQLEMERDAAIQLARSLDLLLFLLPLGLCLFLYTRPLRFGLGLAVVLLLNALYVEEREGVTTLWRGRSYFGIIRVLEANDIKLLPQEAAQLSASEGKNSKISAGFAPPYHYLMHGTTHHGLNYQYPPGLRRLATTYYHRRGPVGVIMERFNWFSTPFLNGKKSAPQNTYWADARMPASIIAYGPDAWSQLINLYSEPPYACVGLGTGTMASYAHPYQHMTFYEIDDTIKSFHVPPYAGDNYFFNYVHDAQDKNRQAQIEIIMGDARLSMAQEQDQHTGFVPQREGYYHCIELDAFSSDAIPVHLITREAIQMYFEKLAPYGVLMVHTSNRHVDLVSPVVDIAASLGLKWRVGKDGGQRYVQGQLVYGEEQGYRILRDPEYRGLFSSEYVMLARYDTVTINGQHFHVLPPETPEAQEAYNQGGERGIAIYQYRHNTLNWYTPRPRGRRLWTDDYSNLLSVFRWGF
jgi:hypothetical protein